MKPSILSRFKQPHPPFPLPVRQAGSPEGEGAKIVVSWRSPSNIALVKYWGKRDGQLPMNPSISMTLNQSCTVTSVHGGLTKQKGGKIISVNDDDQHPFLARLENLRKYVAEEIPVLGNYSFRVETTNTFPHSTGIASSASGISAFTLCLLSIAETLTGEELPKTAFMQAASFISRMGSGSASRSTFGGYTLWGRTPGVSGSSDLFAMPVNDRVYPSLRTLRDTILVVSSTPKSLPSSHGHSLMNNHPFARARIRQAHSNIAALLKALTLGDLDHLAEITETEALTLHALIMSSPGGMILMEPHTLQIIKQIRNARQKGMPVFFSLDAGPNIHLIYPDSAVREVENFIREELIPYCENGFLIYDHCGTGPVRTKLETK
jgi:diphosphomevalonate decarboxylase